MTRASQTISLALLVTSAYLLLAFPLFFSDPSVSPIPSLLPTKIQVEIIPVLPFWALITLACYLLGRLGVGVLTFNDTQAAYDELMGQIDASKRKLKGRGVGTD